MSFRVICRDNTSIHCHERVKSAPHPGGRTGLTRVLVFHTVANMYSANTHSAPAGQNDLAYLAKLRAHWRREHAFPSMQSLCAVLGLASTASVSGVIDRLVEAGLLRKTDGGRVAPTRLFFARPVLGHVRAGVPAPASEQDPDFQVLSLEEYLVDDSDRSAYFRIKGDSMVGAGLADGDIAVLEMTPAAKPGDIVVAVVDDRATCKYLRLDAKGPWLEAANPAYEPIRTQESLEILGVVVSSVRRHRR